MLINIANFQTFHTTHPYMSGIQIAVIKIKHGGKLLVFRPWCVA